MEPHNSADKNIRSQQIIHPSVRQTKQLQSRCAKMKGLTKSGQAMMI
jgi:hypothetical protein